MKLKFIHNLNEADANRGRYLMSIEKIGKIIQNAAEKNGYAFKNHGEEGFYILPRFGYVAKIYIYPFGENIKIKIFDAKGNELTKLQETVPKDKFDAIWKDRICVNIKKLIFDLEARDIKKVQESIITEDIPKFLSDLINKIKGKPTKQDIDDEDKAEAKKQEKEKVDELINKYKAELENQLKGSQITVESEVKEDYLEFTLNSDFIVGAVYKVKDNKIIVDKCITSLKTHEDIECSIPTFISILNRKLGLQIQLDPDMIKAITPNEKEAEKASSFERIIKDNIDSEILKIIGESLDEGLSKGQIDNYDKALRLTKTDDQGINLVKLFFYRQTDNKLQLTDQEASALYRDIKEAQSFDLHKSLLHKIFMTYYFKRKNREELKNLIYILTKNNFIKKLGKITDSSLLYNPAFISNDITSDESQDLYLKHYLVANDTKLNDDSYRNKVLDLINTQVNTTAAIDKNEIKTPREVADFMLFMNYKSKDKIRKYEDISTIYKLIPSSKSYNLNINTDKVKQSTSPTKVDIRIEDIEELKKLFTQLDTNTDDTYDAIRKVKAALKDNSKLKKILAQLVSDETGKS